METNLLLESHLKALRLPTFVQNDQVLFEGHRQEFGETLVVLSLE